MEFLFINVPEVKIEIGHRCLPRVAQGHDLLYDRGTEFDDVSLTGAEELNKGEPDDTFP